MEVGGLYECCQMVSAVAYSLRSIVIDTRDAVGDHCMDHVPVTLGRKLNSTLPLLVSSFRPHTHHEDQKLGCMTWKLHEQTMLRPTKACAALSRAPLKVR